MSFLSADARRFYTFNHLSGHSLLFCILVHEGFHKSNTNQRQTSTSPNFPKNRGDKCTKSDKVFSAVFVSISTDSSTA